MPPITVTDRRASAAVASDENDVWGEEFTDTGGVDKRGLRF
jgi:hypothetical protein